VPLCPHCGCEMLDYSSCPTCEARIIRQRLASKYSDEQISIYDPIYDRYKTLTFKGGCE
jgi:hypothetical protein